MDDIQPGDLLLSSGLGGNFPKGIPVGSIIKVTRKSFGVTQKVEVKPSVDFSKLEEVLVVTHADASPAHVELLEGLEASASPSPFGNSEAMKARLLKALNVPGLFLIALISLALQATLFSNKTIAFFQPDMMVFLVLWVAMKREFGEGGVLTLVFGYIVELKSAAPRGLFLTNYMFLFLITRFLYKNFQVVNRRALVLIGIAAAVFSQLDILFILYLLNKADNQWFHTLQLLAPTAIVHGALIPFVFKALYKFDFITLKKPRGRTPLRARFLSR